MTENTSKDPLHGVTLKEILKVLVEEYDWNGLAKRISIRCFDTDPTLTSSLRFLRKTPWARSKVETLYIKTMKRRRAAEENES
jgi:uncharacterized protein (DUF2132 family)